MTGRLLGHLRGGGAVYADEAYERAQAEKEAPPGPDLRSLQVDAEQLAGIRAHVSSGTDQQLFIERLAADLDAARAERQARLDALSKDETALLEALLVDGRCPLDGFTLARRRRPDVPVEARLFELHCRCGFTFGLG